MTSSAQDSWGGAASAHDYQQQPEVEHSRNSSVNSNSNLRRGPLSPHSAPPTTHVGGWNPASGSNTPVPSVIHTEGDEEGDATMSRAKTYGSAPYFPSINRTSSGNMSMGSVSSTSNLLAKKSSTKVTGKKKHQISKSKSGGSLSVTQPANSPRPHDTDGAVKPGQKKQRRLERNRLSAQLSRRRRKQYLEELEERVVKLSLDMDSGRRAHAFQAIERIAELRQHVLSSAEATVRDFEANRNNDAATMDYQLNNSLRLLQSAGPLSRTNSEELLILNSFLGQQLKSFSLPSHTKFILWLTLQGDIYYRGGRAASERLSAARIGERMLTNGNDKVTPASAMWPLVCNEVGLSYELEERLRVYQRTSVLQEKSTWLDRHTARSSALVMQSFHDTVGAMAQTVGRRESEQTQAILTPAQRVKFLAWANKNSDRIRGRLHARRQRDAQKRKEGNEATAVDIGPYVDSTYELKTSHHLAANLYILNHQLQRIIKNFPYHSPTSLTPAALKKLMRRASFESLGQQKDSDSKAMSREDSFTSSASMKSLASSGSLMKSVSNVSLGHSPGNDSERPSTLNQITPQVGEQAATELVDQAIGFVKAIIPPIPKPMMSATQAAHAIAPTSSAPRTQGTNVAMEYHNYHSPHPAFSSNPSSAPPPQMPQYTETAHYHHHPQPGQLNVHNYSGHPMSHQEYQQPQHEQPEHYYPPQQHVQYASTAGQPLPIAPAYEASSSSPSILPHQQQQQVPSGHVRKSSFLPPHLNVVPEDMFPGVEGTAADFFELQDCLMDEGDDWGIGVGLDMDTTA